MSVRSPRKPRAVKVPASVGSCAASPPAAVALPSVGAYVIDPTRERMQTREEVGALLARWQSRRRPLHPNHVSRLWSTGVRGIVLPSLLVGGRRVSSVEACRWWTQAVSAADSSARGLRSGVVAPLTAQQQETLRRHGLAVGGEA